MKYAKFLALTILLISVSSVLQWCELPIGNTFVWWLLQSFILFTFYKLKPKGYSLPTIKLFLAMLIVNAICGAVFMTENYWDWKMLVANLMVFLLPLACYAYSSPIILSKTLKPWFRFAWILLIVLAPFLHSDAYGRFLVPFSFLSLFFAQLNKKFILLTLVAYAITIILGYESRSDMLKFSVTLFLGIAFIFVGKKKYFLKLAKTICVTLFIAPFIFLYLGLSGTFNIFQIDEELGFEGKYTMKTTDDEDISALADTRTFLYVEEISSAVKYNYYVFGRSIARGYESFAFGQGIDEDLGVKRGERGSCETSILNIFNYFGIFGVLVYLLVFASAVRIALKESKNRFIPLVAICVAFRWTFAWVEDFSRFDLNYLFLWIMIGMCFSPLFRNMTDHDIKLWIKSFAK